MHNNRNQVMIAVLSCYYFDLKGELSMLDF